MANPHPDFADAPLPRHIRLGDFLMEPLGPDCVEEDYDAVMSSADLLSGLSGTWPAGLTLAENLADLHWHAREFDFARSFAWVLRAPDASYLGCAYIYPDLGQRGRGRAWFWLRQSVATPARMADFRTHFAAWLAEQGLSATAYPIQSPEVMAVKTAG